MPENEVTKPRGRPPRGAGETAQVRAQTVQHVVGKLAMLTKAPSRTDLNDADKVKAVADSVVQRCAEAGLLPSFEMLAAALGISRVRLYRFLREKPDSETALFLDSWRTAVTAMRISAVDRGGADATMSIFLLLNSSQDYSNEHKLCIESPPTPFGSDAAAVADVDAVVAALPEPDEE